MELLGTAAKTSPPGTETIGKIFQAAGGPVLILFDEVLNFLNRHRNMADSFYAFFDNINRATTGTTHCAAVMSLPRSQMEMTEWDSQWQDKITKVVRRVHRVRLLILDNLGPMLFSRTSGLNVAPQANLHRLPHFHVFAIAKVRKYRLRRERNPSDAVEVTRH